MKQLLEIFDDYHVPIVIGIWLIGSTAPLFIYFMWFR